MAVLTHCKKCDREIRKAKYAETGLCSFCTPKPSTAKPKAERTDDLRPITAANPVIVERLVIQPGDDLQLLTRKAVAQLIGISYQHIIRMENAGQFPRPLKWGNGKKHVVRYRASDIRAWIETQQANQPA